MLLCASHSSTSVHLDSCPAVPCLHPSVRSGHTNSATQNQYSREAPRTCFKARARSRITHGPSLWLPRASRSRVRTLPIRHDTSRTPPSSSISAYVPSWLVPFFYPASKLLNECSSAERRDMSLDRTVPTCTHGCWRVAAVQARACVCVDGQVKVQRGKHGGVKFVGTTAVKATTVEHLFRIVSS